uniref:Uncharacterized protein n=1 Tax=Oryza barthii TaxID=65489 RepID=A0A0D3H5E1_9ORYZ
MGNGVVVRRMAEDDWVTRPKVERVELEGSLRRGYAAAPAMPEWRYPCLVTTKNGGSRCGSCRGRARRERKSGAVRRGSSGEEARKHSGSGLSSCTTAQEDKEERWWLGRDFSRGHGAEGASRAARRRGEQRFLG